MISYKLNYKNIIVLKIIRQILIQIFIQMEKQKKDLEPEEKEVRADEHDVHLNVDQAAPDSSSTGG